MTDTDSEEVGRPIGESDVVGFETEVWNRPAKVEAVYSEQAKVRFQDNGILDYVPLDALGEVVDDDDDDVLGPRECRCGGFLVWIDTKQRYRCYACGTEVITLER